MAAFEFYQSEVHFRNVQALDVFLKRYYDLLQKRSKAIDSAVAMQKQNEELKARGFRMIDLPIF